MSNIQKLPYFKDALWEVSNEIMRLQVRIDEYTKVCEDRNTKFACDTPRERGAIKRASLDLSAALVKLRKASV
jgi:hypothetical protein